MALPPATLAEQLIGLASSSPAWDQVQVTALELANALRSKGPDDIHTVLGQTDLPTALAKLLSAASESSDGDIPSDAAAPATFEVLRVAANVVMDHDSNRQRLLDAGIITPLLSILQGCAKGVNSLRALPHLRVAKTLIGVLLNLSLGYAPARQALVSVGAPKIILRLIASVYTPGAWSVAQPIQDDSLEAIYQWKSGLVDWAWRAISEIGEGSEDPTIGVESLDVLTSPLQSFIPPFATTSPLLDHEESRHALIAADLSVLDESVTLLEGLSIDSEEVRTAIARSIKLAPNVSPFYRLLQFLELGDYPTYWDKDGQSELAKRQKAFDIYKAAAIKVVVSVAGESNAATALWDVESGPLGGALVSKMVSWVKKASDTPETRRDDLVICGALTLGNLTRNDETAIALVKEPHQVVPSLVSLITPETDIKLKHAATGLLKNLSLAQANLPAIREAGTITKLSRSGLWEQGADMAEVVQVSAIGIAKLICNGYYKSALELAAPPQPSGLDQIIALVGRSDSIVAKSEGTRVIGYVAKSLWRAVEQCSPEEMEPMRTAMTKVASVPAIQALAEMLARNRKHVILLNESILALTLLSGQSVAAPIVKNALVAAVPTSPAPTSPVTPSSPTSALESIVAILTNEGGRFPTELQANCCSLVAALGVHTQVNVAASPEVQKISAAVVGPVAALAESTTVPEPLRRAAKVARGDSS